MNKDDSRESQKISKGARAGAVFAAALTAALAAALTFAPSCKSDDGKPDADPFAADAGTGMGNCDAEPNEWRISDMGAIGAQDDAGTKANLLDIWGVDEKAIWAVGSSGKILFYDGTSWQQQETPTTVQLTSVWGTSVSDVWAAGYEGTVLHFNGSKWESRDPPDVMFVDGDGGVPTGDGSVFARRNLWGIWAAGQNNITSDLYVVGDRGTILYFQNNIWTRVDGGVEEKLTGVWGRNAGRIFIVGDFGTVLMGTATGFTKQQTNTAKALRSVWGRSNNDVWALGLGGTILHYNGTKWTGAEGAPPQFFRDIWGPPGGATYLVGWDGVMMKMTGRPESTEGVDFSPFNCVTGFRLEGIWGTMVDGPPPDGGIPDAGVPQIPAIWIVGMSSTVITGP